MAPHQHLLRRAELRVSDWVNIIIVIICLVSALFCIVILLLICKRKRARRQRQRKMETERGQRSLQEPTVAQPFLAHERRVSEEQRGNMGYGTNGPIELQSGVVETETPKIPQELDGNIAPAAMAYDGKPVEMPAQAAVQ
ncbi:hypothetical protein GQ44DRAFT_345073 [Phaeosphaeriaceae sp. PMI808]|nr:hypothetical protein GQ44DRAFT_345073 [Phaeosphaeriaceae sp. PMI808]